MRRELLLVIAACHAQPAPDEPPRSRVTPPQPHATGGRRVVTDTQVELLEPVKWVGVQIAPGSYKTLDAVAGTLAGNPDIKLLEVDAFAPNQSLADGRARAYATYLVNKGVAPNRLRPVGNVDTNERVQLLILQRGP